MDMQGEYRIPAPRDQVWAALNDPEILKNSIPGCENLEKTGDNSYRAAVTAKVGPVKSRFTGEVTMSNIDPPNSYTISGEGKGGAAGFARGSADVRLKEDGSDTLLNYTVHANVGGKLAQLGSRLIDGTARKMADDFFARFVEQAGRAAPPPTPVPPQPPAAETPLGKTAEKVPEAAPEAMQPTPEEVEARRAGPAPAEEPAPPPPEQGLGGGIPTWAWAAGVVIVILLLLIFWA